MRVIISGMPAVGKSGLAELIANRFGLKNVCAGDLLKQIAQSNGYLITETNWWETDDAFNFCEKRLKDPQFDKLLDDQIIRTLDDDNVVSTARAMPWLYKKECRKIWLSASEEIRAKRLSARDKISIEIAFKVIKHRDASDKKLLFLLYGINLESDFAPFDLVLSTEKLTQQEVEFVVTSFLEGASV
jgi:CMP/dCMP kinase